MIHENIRVYGVCAYKDVDNLKELRKKISWFNEYYAKGLRIKAVISEEGGFQGMLEYIPGEYAHRPVNAIGHMFIHCVFVGFKKAFKGKGYASALIDECIKEAKEGGMHGVAVVTRKGSFMVDEKIFLKKGFEVVDTAKPDFRLLALNFNPKGETPSFKSELFENLKETHDGLIIMRSYQCPYTEKNVNTILKTAKEKYKLSPRLVDLNDAESAQKNPSPFGTFSIIFNGKVISHHPISNTRFENIMKKELG